MSLTGTVKEVLTCEAETRTLGTCARCTSAMSARRTVVGRECVVYARYGCLVVVRLAGGHQLIGGQRQFGGEQADIVYQEVIARLGGGKVVDRHTRLVIVVGTLEGEHHLTPARLIVDSRLYLMYLLPAILVHIAVGNTRVGDKLTVAFLIATALKHRRVNDHMVVLIVERSHKQRFACHTARIRLRRDSERLIAFQRPRQPVHPLMIIGIGERELAVVGIYVIARQCVGLCDAVVAIRLNGLHPSGYTVTL